jgi:hypothetical protein
MSRVGRTSLDRRAQYPGSDTDSAGESKGESEPQNLEIDVNIQGEFQPMPKKDVRTDKPGSVCRRISVRHGVESADSLLNFLPEPDSFAGPW